MIQITRIYSRHNEFSIVGFAAAESRVTRPQKVKVGANLLELKIKLRTVCEQKIRPARYTSEQVVPFGHASGQFPCYHRNFRKHTEHNVFLSLDFTFVTSRIRLLRSIVFVSLHNELMIYCVSITKVDDDTNWFKSTTTKVIMNSIEDLR